MTETNMGDIVRQALVSGWRRWQHDGKASQCLYRSVTGRIAFVEGVLREQVYDLVDMSTGGVSENVSGGKLISKRLAARLADWAGWEQGSVLRKELVEYIERGGEANSVLKHEVWSAERAYGSHLNGGSCACDAIDDFRFCPVSCMDDTPEHGEALDDLAGEKLEIWVWDELEGNDGITRVEVWRACNGDLWAGAIYGCPVVQAHRLAEYLREQGVKPLSEMGWDVHLYVSGESLPYSIGYCDYLHYDKDKGGWYVTTQWRPRGHPWYQDVTYGTVCGVCGDWMDAEEGCGPDGQYCDNECAYEAGYQKCRCCGEWYDPDDDTYGPTGQFCSEHCAEWEGYRRCEECSDWFSEGEGYGPDRGFCCDACAKNADYHCCEECSDWFSEGEGFNGRNEFCSLQCSIMGRKAKCRQCGTMYKVSQAPNEGLPYCSRRCALRADSPTCLWCGDFVVPGEGVGVHDEYCSPTCYQYHKDERDVKQGQMFLNKRLLYQEEEVSV